MLPSYTWNSAYHFSSIFKHWIVEPKSTVITTFVLIHLDLLLCWLLARYFLALDTIFIPGN